MNQTTSSCAGHTDHWESYEQLHIPKYGEHTCLYTMEPVSFPSLGQTELPLLLQASLLSSYWSSASKTLSQPPTQKGGRGWDRWTVLVTQRAVLCSALILSFLLFSFLLLKSGGLKVREGSSPQRAAWCSLSVSGTRRKWFCSLRMGTPPCPRFFPLYPRLPLQRVLSLNLLNSLHVPLLQLPSSNQIQFHSLMSPPSAPVPHLPNSLSFPASSLFPSNIQL